MADRIKITSLEPLTHDVLRIVADKPVGLNFTPGQAADISINRPGWEQEMRAFTFTSLPEEDHVEFTIKTYPSRHGVTNELLSLGKGDELLLHDVFGDIGYKGEGVFIAGGAGITPFIAILKHLEKEGAIGGNTLIFANKTKADIILEERFRQMLGAHFINVLSEEQCDGYEHGYVTPELIAKHMEGRTPYFYLCGPDPMVDAVQGQLKSLGVAEMYIVREGF